MSTKLLKEERAAEALLLIARWGRLRPQELGRLLHGYAEHSKKYAEVYCRKLAKLGLVLARKLPGGVKNGTAYVLSEAGARWLAAEHGKGFKSGKDWGSTKDGEWQPPACWEHDLRAYGVLSHLHAKGFEVLPEKLVRGDEPRSEKHPDGLIVSRKGGLSFWLEVEGSRKSGKRDLLPLVEALVLAARGTPVCTYEAVQDCPIKGAAVAIDRDAKDERGYKLDHWARIEEAIRKRGLKEPVQLGVIWVQHEGVGVKDIAIEVKTISPRK